VLPISSPGIENGAVLVRGNKVAAVGPWREIVRKGNAKVVDLGEAALLPGLVNAHCHLDYTDMAGHLRPTGIFTDWLKLITELKAGWGYDDFADSWRHGADMLLRTGCTTVADIEAVPELLPAMWRATPLRVFSFLEMIGITARRPPEVVLGEIRSKLKELGRDPRLSGISPHAPYSTVPELLRRSATMAHRNKLKLCVHIAESKLEFEMFARARGEMFHWLRRSGRDMSDCGRITPVKHAWSCGVLNDRLLAVHVNYLGRGDVEVLRRAKAHVIHCPRSHEYFGHENFRLMSLRRAGLNVCLGTDSLASVIKSRRQEVRLSMFEEMQTLMRNHRDISPRTALRMSTLAGARALGLQGKIGEIVRGACADLIAVPAPRSGNLTEAVVHHRDEVLCSMIAGKWIIHPSGAEVSGRRGRRKAGGP
jgi:aminodeoxyfutalosine deaminase